MTYFSKYSFIHALNTVTLTLFGVPYLWGSFSAEVAGPVLLPWSFPPDCCLPCCDSPGQIFSLYINKFCITSHCTKTVLNYKLITIEKKTCIRKKKTNGHFPVWNLNAKAYKIASVLSVKVLQIPHFANLCNAKYFKQIEFIL